MSLIDLAEAEQACVVVSRMDDITLGDLPARNRSFVAPLLNDANAIALAEAFVLNMDEREEVRLLAMHVLRVTPRPKVLPANARTPSSPPFDVPDVESRSVVVSNERDSLETIDVEFDP